MKIIFYLKRVLENLKESQQQPEYEMSEAESEYLDCLKRIIYIQGPESLNKIETSSILSTWRIPIQEAIQFGFIETTKYLIKNKANLNIKIHHDSPLELAKKFNRKEIIKLLEDSGVK